MTTEQVNTFYSPNFEQECILCKHGLHGQSTEHQKQIQSTIVGEPEVVYRTPEVIVSQTIGEPIPVKRGITQIDQSNIQALNSTPQKQIVQSQQINGNTTVSFNQQYIANSKLLSPNQQNSKLELAKSQQIKTFYSGKYEDECYLCKNGLHGINDIQHQNVKQYEQKQIDVSLQKTQQINTQQQLHQINQVRNIGEQKVQTFYSGKYEDECYLCKNGLHGVNDTQHQNVKQQEIQQIDVTLQQTQQINTQQQQLHQINEVRNTGQQNIQTFYSDKYENQCYLCQHGLHGQEQNQVLQGQEVIVSQNVGQPIGSRQEYTSTVQNFSQLLNTPNRDEIYKSQQVQYQSPIQNIQTQQIIPPVQVQQQQIPLVQQQEKIETQQVYLNQQFGQNQLTQQNLAYSQQIIPSVYQQQVKYIQNPIQYQSQVIQQQPIYQQQQILKQQIPLQVINSVQPVQQQRIIQQQEINIQTNQIEGQTVSAQEQIETYWRFKVYELQERVYELMNEINTQKQLNQQAHQRTGSQVKKSAEDQFKLEQLQQEIKELDKQFKNKSRTSIDLRNKLNQLIYQQDPTEDATKYKEQELQQLRQRYNTLNFKFQSNEEDIAMTQAVLDAIKSGKGYKIVREQQSVQHLKQYSNSQQQQQG